MTCLSSPILIQPGLPSITCLRQPPHFIPIHPAGRVLCVQGTGNAAIPPVPVDNDAREENSNSNSNSNSKTSADEFSGWSNVNVSGGDSAESQGEKWNGGIVGAGVAGVILVAGLTFAALSVSKRRTKPEQYMEPLTTEQELTVDTKNMDDAKEELKNEGKNATLDTDAPRFKTGISGKVLVPAVVDQIQRQALAALQVLKVIEADAKPGDLCTRREYARWLVTASSALSRNTASKVYPAMFIENITELAFDDVTPEDPDFPSIQGLAEAGLIFSKFSRHDMRSASEIGETSLCFCPESPLSRQDLVSWKRSLEKRQLPVADKQILQQVSGFLDIDSIDQDACPALVADLSAGEQGIVALAFGYTRRFQPNKAVTKAQAAIALANGEASYIVSEEIGRIEAEFMTEKAVAAHSALVDQVEKDTNTSFEKELLIEREKVVAVEKLAEGAMAELENIRAEQEERNIALMKKRAVIDSEKEILSCLRLEVKKQLDSLMSDQVEVSSEKRSISKLQKEAGVLNQEISRLQHELEVERKALSMARTWAEDEVKGARVQAKVLEEARSHYERQGIKVVVDNDLKDEANAAVSWINAGTELSVEGTVSRSAETLVDKLKAMAFDLRGRSKDVIDKIVQKKS